MSSLPSASSRVALLQIINVFQEKVLPETKRCRRKYSAGKSRLNGADVEGFVALTALSNLELDRLALFE